MANPATVEEMNGLVMTPEKFESCCAMMMFKTAGCCTPFTFTPVIQPDGETVQMTKNTVCFCMRMSPVPCCMGFGWGPCAYVPAFKKVSDTEWAGLEDVSNLGGGCCGCCFNEKGAKLYVKDGRWIYHAGGAMANPPCLQNSDIATMVYKGGSKEAAAPAEDMER